MKITWVRVGSGKSCRASWMPFWPSRRMSRMAMSGARPWPAAWARRRGGKGVDMIRRVRQGLCQQLLELAEDGGLVVTKGNVQHSSLRYPGKWKGVNLLIIGEIPGRARGKCPKSAEKPSKIKLPQEGRKPLPCPGPCVTINPSKPQRQEGWPWTWRP